MLLAAMMRARCVGWLRIWISAYMGTLYRPANRLSSARSAITRQWAGCATKAARPITSEAGRPRAAKYRSMAKTLMPMAPSGTRPISTWRRESTSHKSEPVPMPMENTTSSSEATCSLPCSTSLAKLGNWLKNTAPKNHIQLIPSSERNTTMFSCASFRLRQVSVKGFQLMVRCGSVAGTGGMNCATARPISASSTQARATVVCPMPGMATSRPPATLPSKMATNVPISTMPLPPVSSRSLSTWGM